MSNLLWNAIVLIVSLGVLIMVHELGHFLVAKRCKISVLEFAIGMGPKLFSKQHGETLYSIRAIPLGGFCRMEDESETETPGGPGAFQNHPKWQRFLTLIAGGVMNLVLGYFVMALLFSLAVPYTTTQVSEVVSGSAAEEAGILPGDRITAVNGNPVSNATEFSDQLFDRADQPLTLTIDRNGQTHTFSDVRLRVAQGEQYQTPMLGVVWAQRETHFLESTVVDSVRPGSIAAKKGLKAGDRILSINDQKVRISQDLSWHFTRNGYEPYNMTVLRNGEKITLQGIGIDQKAYEGDGFSYVRSSLGYTLASVPQTLGTVLKTAFYYTGFMVRVVVSSLYQLVSGGASLDQMTGLVGISGELGAAAKRGLSDFLNILGMLSVNLGIVNLLPLPALDGGRIFFLLIEAIRGKPIPPEREGLVHGIGFVLLILLAIVININDIIKLWS